MAIIGPTYARLCENIFRIYVERENSTNPIMILYHMPMYDFHIDFEIPFIPFAWINLRHDFMF